MVQSDRWIKVTKKEMIKSRPSKSIKVDGLDESGCKGRRESLNSRFSSGITKMTVKFMTKRNFLWICSVQKDRYLKFENGHFQQRSFSTTVILNNVHFGSHSNSMPLDLRFFQSVSVKMCILTSWWRFLPE